MAEHVVVITGAGGIGLSAARRITHGRKIFFGSRSHQSLETAKSTLEWEGYQVETCQLDVRDADSVQSFARKAAAIGSLDVVLHTSGISPAQCSSAQELLEINLLGTAHVIDAFLDFMRPASTLIVISSIAAHMTWGMPVPPQRLDKQFATGATSQLLESVEFQSLQITDPIHAYIISKRANNLRVQGFAQAYGAQGARINSVSPAAVMTKMAYTEMNQSGAGEYIKENGALKRHATPEDVAATIAFLASRESSYITGTDVLIDGGSTAGLTWNPSGHELFRRNDDAREGRSYSVAFQQL